MLPSCSTCNAADRRRPHQVLASSNLPAEDEPAPQPAGGEDEQVPEEAARINESEKLEERMSSGWITIEEDMNERAKVEVM